MRTRRKPIRPGPLTVFLLVLFSLSAISVDRMQTTVAWMSDPARDGRLSQSPGAIETADYLLERFREIGLEAAMQDIGPGRRNVVARWGAAADHVIVGAHFDGQGRGYASASDNAAGVALMLELARDLKQEPLPVSLVFIAFDDEERGLHGSRHYANNPVYPLSDARAVVILDTMGRSFVDLDRWTLIVFGTEFSPQLNATVLEHGTRDTIRLGTDLLGPRSDFAPFAAKEIPYLFFTNATHVDYHGAGDTPDRLDYDRLRQDGETIRQVIVDIARMESGPSWREEPDYRADEPRDLLEFLDAIEAEREDLASAYIDVLGDLRQRLDADPSRDNLRLATTVMLSVATPSVSSFSLAYLIGPFYEAEGETELAVAVYREALRWTPNPFVRKTIEEKIESLLH